MLSKHHKRLLISIISSSYDTRKEIFILFVNLLGVYKSSVFSLEMSSPMFPKEFLFATASSAYQIEGAWNEDGKGENIWDRFKHTKSDTIKHQENGDISCDSYHLYKEDVKLIKDAGFNLYRFSISWSRILPNGEITLINQKGVDYYHNLIDELLKNEIQPMVTMYHWDLPQKLQDLGGWTNPLIVDYMEDYADLLFQLYGDKVKWWITINEPVFIAMGYEWRIFAPGLGLESPANYIAMHNTLRAHGRIYRLYDEKYRSKQKGKLSIVNDCIYFEGKTTSKEDLEAGNRAMQFNLGLMAHPIYSKEGGYPKIAREIIDELSKKEGRKRSRLPKFTEEEIQSLKGSFDFFAMNHYTTRLCEPISSKNDSKPDYTDTFTTDGNVMTSFDPTWPNSSSSWLKVAPHGIREVLKYIKDNYDNPPVFIAENGYSDYGELEDNERISYFKEYLKEISNAINNHQCNVIGYTAWSLLDSFEWAFEYKAKFGLVQVDFNDEKRKRTPKASYNFFKQFLKTRIIPE